MNAAPEVPDRDSRKAGGRSARRGGRGGDIARELGDRLGRAARLAGYEWWWTARWTAIADEWRGIPLVVALEGLAGALRSGRDPDVVVGGDGADLAVEVAGEWLAAGVDPGDVGGWVRSGCWRPAAARAMADAGIRPAQLLRDDTPRHLVDSVSGWPIPLARAVADDEMTVEATVAHLRSLADTYLVRAERVGRSWRLRIDGLAEGEVPNLREIEPWARAAIARHRGGVVDGVADGVYVATEVRLPDPVQAAIDRAAQLRKEGEHPASDAAARRLALDGWQAEQRGAARELAALGVTVADVAGLLDVTTREAHDLLRR
jgi:hypothetical protein